MKKRNLLLVLAGATIMSSCIKDKYDFTETKIDYTPTIALPLIESNVITKDLLAGIDTSIISAGPNDVLRVVFNDTLKSVGLSEFLTIESKAVVDSSVVGAIAIPNEFTTDSATLGQIKNGLSADKQIAIDAAIASSDAGNPVVVTKIDPSPAGEQTIGSLSGFSTVTFSEGQMKITVTNKFTIPLHNIVMDLKSGGVVIGTFTYDSIPSLASKADSIQLGSETMTPDMKLDITSFGSNGSYGAEVLMSTSDVMVFDVALTGVKVRSGTVEIEDTEILNQSVDMDLGLTDEVLTEVTFSTMSMDYDIDLGIQSAAKIYVDLPGATKDGMTYSDSITIIRGNAASGKGSFDLSGYKVTLTANKIRTNMRALLIKEAGSPIAFDSADVAKFTFTPTNIAIASVEGYFGSQVIDFADEEVSTGISNDELLTALTLSSPVITMSFDNSFDIPMQFDTLNMIASGGNGGDITLTGLALPFTIAEGPNKVKTTSQLEIAAPATNIDDAINAQATKFIVGGSASINPNGNTGAVNKADTNSRLTVRLNVEVPMHGSIKGMVISDTMELDMGALIDATEMIILRSVITNEFPLNGKIQMVFVDSLTGFTELDSLVVAGGDGSFMAAAEVDADGVTKVDPATGKFIGSTKTNDFTLTKATLAKLGTTTHIILKVTIDSGVDALGADKIMKILSTYNMNIKLGVIAKISAQNLIDSED